MREYWAVAEIRKITSTSNAIYSFDYVLVLRDGTERGAGFLSASDGSIQMGALRGLAHALPDGAIEIGSRFSDPPPVWRFRSLPPKTRVRGGCALTMRRYVLPIAITLSALLQACPPERPDARLALLRMQGNRSPPERGRGKGQTDRAAERIRRGCDADHYRAAGALRLNRHRSLNRPVCRRTTT